MIENITDSVAEWMLLSAALGFLVGEVTGNHARHRKCLQQANEELREQLQEVHAGQEPLDRAIKQQRGVINDIHKQLVALAKAFNRAFPGYAATVLKGPENHPS
jgi:septal ring factor EnvC (AmiA/AmiB activator)